MALVDSGADYPIFPLEVAVDELKLDLTKAPGWFSPFPKIVPRAKLIACR
jgi:hypothetical protein